MLNYHGCDGSSACDKTCCVCNEYIFSFLVVFEQCSQVIDIFCNVNLYEKLLLIKKNDSSTETIPPVSVQVPKYDFHFLSCIGNHYSIAIFPMPGENALQVQSKEKFAIEKPIHPTKICCNTFTSPIFFRT